MVGCLKLDGEITLCPGNKAIDIPLPPSVSAGLVDGGDDREAGPLEELTRGRGGERT